MARGHDRTVASEVQTRHDGAATVLRAGVLEIAPDEGLALADGTALSLSALEVGLLAELVRHEGRVLRREDLYERVWGARLRQGDRIVDVYVRRLRVKLEHSLPEWRFIHTHVGFGYRFAAERSHGFHSRVTAP